MMLQRMTMIKTGKTYTGFLERRNNEGPYFVFWDPEVDNGKFEPKGKWLVGYLYDFKPDF